jgi:hypothetical protein
MKLAPAIATLLALSLLGCSGGREVSEAIGNKVRVQNVKEIRLTEATNFKWEKVHFFGPYMPRSKICEVLGVQANQCESVVPHESVEDGLMSMAFVSGTRVVRYELHARWNGDFTPFPKTQPIPAEQAVFRVVPDGLAANGTTWLRLVLQ